jgi:hypothetical protein
LQNHYPKKEEGCQGAFYKRFLQKIQPEYKNRADRDLFIG